MPTVKPFRALRYTAAAGPLDDLVAPPYDVISEEQRRDYLARSPYNVVHLTLPDSEEQAAADLADWRARGVLVEHDERYWWIAQDYVGPDGIARTREGRAASVPRAPGLEIFPTHRLAREVGDVPGEEVDAPEGGVTLYRDGRYLRVRTDDDFGPRVVESLAPVGVSYTAYADEAIATVDRGDAAAAFLLEPVTVEQVARFAQAGETMPQKSTFFFPKLTSGLLFHPVG